MKGQMLPLICLHNSPWSPGWLIPTQGLPACHPVTRVFYSRRSEPNKEPNQGPRSPERKATDACALNGRSWPIAYANSPQSCNRFYGGGPDPRRTHWCQARDAGCGTVTHLHHTEDGEPASAKTPASTKPVAEAKLAMEMEGKGG